MTAAADTSAHLDPSWQARLDETATFVERHGRFPRQKGEDSAERSLSNWLIAQHRKSDGARGHRPHTAEQTAALNATLPGWRGRVAAPAVAWEQRLGEVKTYRDAYGKWPSWRSGDPHVKVLAAWMTSQRHSGLLTPERRAVLDSQLPGWNETPAQAWFRIADDVAAFRERAGEWPAYSSSEASVRRLAKWLLDQRTGRNVSPEREAYLDRVLPGWRVGVGHGVRPLELWERGIVPVERFRDTHGRLPRISTRNRSEQRPAQWLEKQRQDKTMTEVRRRILDTRLPGWEESDRLTMEQWRQAQDASWNSKFDEVVRYVETRGKYPSQRSEPALYGWVDRLRTRPVSLERQAVLDERLPGWREPRGRKAKEKVSTLAPAELVAAAPALSKRTQQWMAKLEEVAALHGRHGRFPRSSEVSLYSWLNRQQVSIRLEEWQAEALDSRLPGWQGGAEYAPLTDAA